MKVTEEQLQACFEASEAAHRAWINGPANAESARMVIIRAALDALPEPADQVAALQDAWGSANARIVGLTNELVRMREVCADVAEALGMANRLEDGKWLIATPDALMEECKRLRRAASEADEPLALRAERDAARSQLAALQARIGREVEAGVNEQLEKRARPAARTVVIDEELAERACSLWMPHTWRSSPAEHRREHICEALHVLHALFGDRVSVEVEEPAPHPGPFTPEREAELRKKPTDACELKYALQLRRIADAVGAETLSEVDIAVIELLTSNDRELADCQVRLKGTLALADEHVAEKARLKIELMEMANELADVRGRYENLHEVYQKANAKSDARREEFEALKALVQIQDGDRTIALGVALADPEKYGKRVLDGVLRLRNKPKPTPRADRNEQQFASKADVELLWRLVESLRDGGDVQVSAYAAVCARRDANV